MDTKEQKRIMPKTILKSSWEAFWIVAESYFELFSGSVLNDHLWLCPNKISGTSTKDILGSCPKARLTQCQMHERLKQLLFRVDHKTWTLIGRYFQYISIFWDRSRNAYYIHFTIDSLQYLWFKHTVNRGSCPNYDDLFIYISNIHVFFVVLVRKILI